MDGAHFAGRLLELRQQAGLSQKQLAERVQMSVDGLSRLERGDRKPTWETVLALCEALGVECTAFCQAPAARPEPQRGRPRKAPPVEAPKRRPGRPPKGG